MKKPVGPLGWTAVERDEFDRTGKEPERTVEVRAFPRGNTLTSLPSPEYLRGYVDGLRAKVRPRGAPSKVESHLALAAECLGETNGRIEEARKLYIARSRGVERDTASRQFSRASKILQTLWASD